MRKKIVVCLLVFVLAFSFVGCKTESQIKSITLSDTSIAIDVGQSKTISAIVLPADAKNKDVTYKSDKTNIATVDFNGKITGVSAGSAVISATAGDKKATCNVTVKALSEVEAINGFKAFAKGGLIGGPNGTYYPVTTTAVGTDSVKFTGKGGFSWPDTENNPEPDAMGGYYDSALNLDGLKVKYKIDVPMDFDGDHWYIIAIANQKQLFNSWNGSDPVKTSFIMVTYENGKVVLKPHYRDVIELGESWGYLGAGQGVTAEKTDEITIEFHKTSVGYEIYLNGEVQYFDNIKSNYITVYNDLFGDDDVYLMAGAHIGNPGAQFEGEYAYTLGVDKSASAIIDATSISLNKSTATIFAGDTETLTATITPTNASNKNIVFSSSDNLIATVDSTGKITAVGEGTATITAKLGGLTATCSVTVETAQTSATGISFDKKTLSIKQFETKTLTATVAPADASNKNVLWTISDGKTNIDITPDADDKQIAEIYGKFIGEVTITAKIGTLTDSCVVTITTGTLNGFKQFEIGGLVNNANYNSDITMIDCGTTDRVQFKGKGGTNWGDTTKSPSTMGGYYDSSLNLNNLEIYYSVNDWVPSGEHFYTIAISDEKHWFGNSSPETSKTLFFNFAYDNGNVTLRAHTNGPDGYWIHIGVSQGVAAAGGEYTIKLEYAETGYKVYMKNAGGEYVLQSFGGTEIITTAKDYFGDGTGGVYLMGGAYVATYSDPWAFTLGVNEAS